MQGASVCHALLFTSMLQNRIPLLKGKLKYFVLHIFTYRNGRYVQAAYLCQYWLTCSSSLQGSSMQAPTLKCEPPKLQGEPPKLQCQPPKSSGRDSTPPRWAPGWVSTALRWVPRLYCKVSVYTSKLCLLNTRVSLHIPKVSLFYSCRLSLHSSRVILHGSMQGEPPKLRGDPLWQQGEPLHLQDELHSSTVSLHGSKVSLNCSSVSCILQELYKTK